MNKTFLAVLLVITFSLSAFAQGPPRQQHPQQQPPPPPGYQPPGDDPIRRNLFPPELVMKHGEEIGLDDSQRTEIRNEVYKAQSKFLDLQWQLEAEAEKVSKLLEINPVDEAKVLQQMEKVTSLEREIKKIHISLLIRIKNKLNQQQQAKLKELRKRDDREQP